MISVCLATYNGEDFILTQVQSILSQLAKEDELIISDDASTDNTLNIINDLNDSRVMILNHNKNICSSTSEYATRNFENALCKAKGDYIFLSDQDDVWLPNKITIMTKYLHKYDMVISDALITDENLNVIHKTRFYPGCGQTRNLLKAYFSTHPYQGSCMAFNRKVLGKALPFPPKVTSHDTWLGYVATTFFKTRLIPEKLMYYRRHENVVSRTGEKSKNSLFRKVSNRLKYLYLIILRGCHII